MLGLLLRVAIGVTAAVAAGAIAYTVYKRITRKTIAEEARKQCEKEDISENDILKKALKAKITEVEKSQGTVTVDILDGWDNEVLSDVEIHGEEIDGSLRKGQEIRLDLAS